MKIDRDSLRVQFEGHSDETLGDIAANGDYSEVARGVALELLVARGRGDRGAPRAVDDVPEADAGVAAPAPKRPPPTRAMLLLMALPMLVVSVAGMWIRATERDRVREELQRVSQDPATAALAEAAARGEVAITVDRDGQIHTIPVAPDGGQRPP
jgi:hypothetical protein